MICEIISVGTEVVTGDIVDTNAPYLSKELVSLGIDTMYRTTVPDIEKAVSDVLYSAKQRADLVITIGGLGPTYDDFTKEQVAKINGLKLIHSKEIENNIRDYFLHMNRTMSENNLKQAKIIEGCTVLKNNNGTAPGMIVTAEDTVFILLPGPPSELIPMFENEVKAHLCKMLKHAIIEKNIKLFGVGESYVESVLYDLMTSTRNPVIAPYAKVGEVFLKLTASADTKEEAQELLRPVYEKIYLHFEKNIYGEDEDTLEGRVIALLKEKGMKISLCESCTGGYIAKQLTDIPGASEVFGYGVVTYSNEAKIKLAGVSPIALENYGAVSEQIAAQMAKGIRSISGADIGIGVTGIAGPDGGSEEKPVGLVYIGISTRNTVITHKMTFSGNRERVRLMVAKTVFAEVLKYLK